MGEPLAEEEVECRSSELWRWKPVSGVGAFFLEGSCDPETERWCDERVGETERALEDGRETMV